MAARLTLLLPRLVALVLIWLLALASFTFAAGGKQQQTQSATAKAKKAPPKVLVVPDVRGQAYVFAKGILQDAGFAWRVEGSVKGYSANTVAVQTPAPGARVVDNGAPTVVVRLQRNGAYRERGLPENSSPYRGTPVVLLRDYLVARIGSKPAKPKPAPAKKAKKSKKKPAQAPSEQPQGKYRKPDFLVPNAPREPAKELPLPQRARLVEQRAAAIAAPSRKFTNWWLYQHSWVVTGALFGWQDGDEALRILIRADERLQRRFGFGAKSEAVARRALREVQSRKG
jgi:PASTA domain